MWPSTDKGAQALAGAWNEVEGKPYLEGSIYIRNESSAHKMIQTGTEVALVGYSRVVEFRCWHCKADIALVGEDAATCECPECGFPQDHDKIHTDPALHAAYASSATQTARVGHILENTESFDKMLAEEAPPAQYYAELRKDRESAFPQASPHFLDHMLSLEGLLDIAIVTGFSFGANKAQILQKQGLLLGDKVKRNGIRVNPERTKAIINFATLKETQHVMQL